MTIATFIRYNTNDTLPSPNAGDLPIVVVDISISSSGANSYPAGGEALDFGLTGLNVFREVHACIPTLLEEPRPSLPNTTSLSVLWERDPVSIMDPKFNAGHLRFYQSAGALAPLAELPPGTLYSTLFSFAELTVLVVGRPFSDAS